MTKGKLMALLDGLQLLAEVPVDHPDRRAAIVTLYQVRDLAQSLLTLLTAVREQVATDVVRDKTAALLLEENPPTEWRD